MPFRNLAREYSTTTGTGSCVLTGAVPGCNTWENAGVANGEVVRYGIITYDTATHRPTHSELGIGAYTTADNTLARTTVESSTNGGSKIELTGLSEVYICPSRKDHSILAVYYGEIGAVNNGSTDVAMDISTEWTDEHGLATLASDQITVNYNCWVRLSATVSLAAATAFNGKVTFTMSGVSLDYTKPYATADSIQADTIVLGPSMCQLTAGNIVSIQVDNSLGSQVNFTVEDVTLEAWLR